MTTGHWHVLCTFTYQSCWRLLLQVWDQWHRFMESCSASLPQLCIRTKMPKRPTGFQNEVENQLLILYKYK